MAGAGSSLKRDNYDSFTITWSSTWLQLGAGAGQSAVTTRRSSSTSSTRSVPCLSAPTGHAGAGRAASGDPPAADRGTPAAGRVPVTTRRS
ncbi:hypothetical protein HBB16_04860 [Pseudonocardia sp. MCCB 268]|nr:hypothetical protein [Pseudonocardia cytotoxica]